jgi:hypothetical protein
MNHEPTQSELDLFNQVADKWGGKDCPRKYTLDTCAFVSNDGARYKVYWPGEKFPVVEDSGRPSGSITVKAGYLYVRCQDDAPDCWWSVDIELFTLTEGKQYSGPYSP